MNPKKFTGPQAGSQKYDLLTAIAVAGLSGTQGFQTSMMRLVALVTARYNWSRDEFTVGQRELARMWFVDERTVKREIKRLRSANILLQLRPGVRGRVAAYRLNCSEIYRLSAPIWESVGPDYAQRMQSQHVTGSETVVKVDFGRVAPESVQSDFPNTTWGRIAQRIAGKDPAIYKSWFSELKFGGVEQGTLTLIAPSKFVAHYVETHLMERLRTALGPEESAIHRIAFTLDPKG